MTLYILYKERKRKKKNNFILFKSWDLCSSLGQNHVLRAFRYFYDKEEFMSCLIAPFGFFVTKKNIYFCQEKAMYSSKTKSPPVKEKLA